MGPLALKREEHFTYGDYLTWDDGQRWELIDGVPYNMSPAPRLRHQAISRELLTEFALHLRGNSCQVFAAPFDVRLPESDESDDLVETVVQPDLLVVCDKTKLDDAGCRGAPDLIVEILSPSTADKDLKVKFDRYQRAGVREYWIVDPTGSTVQLYTVGMDGKYGRPEVFGAADRVSVGIFPNLEIDLATVFAE